MGKALKAFMKDKFDFSGLKKAGVYPKDIKHTDYEGQAKIICHLLGLDNIYDYGKYEIRCHISYADPKDPSGMENGSRTSVDENGKLSVIPFVETIFPNSLHL